MMMPAEKINGYSKADLYKTHCEHYQKFEERGSLIAKPVVTMGEVNEKSAKITTPTAFTITPKQITNASMKKTLFEILKG